MPTIVMFGQSTFRKHDEARYDQFLEECEKEALLPPEERTKKGKRVSAGVLLPHKLVERAKSLEQKEDSPISSAVSEVNLQWLRLVEDTQASGKLPSALAVCDVSGSMYGEPMEVAVALSLTPALRCGGRALAQQDLHVLESSKVCHRAQCYHRQPGRARMMRRREAAMGLEHGLPAGL